MTINHMIARGSVSILLADDDDGHATLVERNLRRAGVVNNITRFRNGREILEYIEKSTGPDPLETTYSLVILLDINMPEIDGVEVLRRLKSNVRTAQLPIIMLTTTDDPKEVERCYKLGCNIYITKPVDYEAFIEAVRRLGLFLQVVDVPFPTSSRAAT